MLMEINKVLEKTLMKECQTPAKSTRAIKFTQNFIDYQTSKTLWNTSSEKQESILEHKTYKQGFRSVS